MSCTHRQSYNYWSIQKCHYYCLKLDTGYSTVLYRELRPYPKEINNNSYRPIQLISRSFYIVVMIERCSVTSCFVTFSVCVGVSIFVRFSWTVFIRNACFSKLLEVVYALLLLRTPVGAHSYRANAFLLDWYYFFLSSKEIHSTDFILHLHLHCRSIKFTHESVWFPVSRLSLQLFCLPLLNSGVFTWLKLRASLPRRDKEPKLVKFCTRVGYIHSNSRMTYHQ